MGNCLGTCFGQAKKKTNYFTGRYKNYDVGIEFENLIEDESNPNADVTVLTELERQHLLTKRFTDLERDQKARDAEIDAELRRQEDNLRIEEESYNDARREAARAVKQARVQQDKKKQSKDAKANGSVQSSWLGDDEDWDVAGGEDDFEMFLDSVKARSQAIRANVSSLVCATNRQATNNNTISSHQGDNSVTSTNTTDLEWEYDQGFTGPTGSSSKPYQKEETDLATKPSSKKTSFSMVASVVTPTQVEVKTHDSDLEWDSDFVSADTDELGVQMQSEMPSGDSESVVRAIEDKNANLEPAGKAIKSAIRTDDKKASNTPKHSGIDATPNVQSVSSTKPVSATIIAPKQKQTTPALSKHSNMDPEKRPLVNKDATTKTDEIASGIAHSDATNKDSHTTNTVDVESEEDLDEFDIDKFLEELDFDT